MFAWLAAWWAAWLVVQLMQQADGICVWIVAVYTCGFILVFGRLLEWVLGAAAMHSAILELSLTGCAVSCILSRCCSWLP
jgi:uncharacterized membrane protein YecN with MAPEG domain